MVSSCHLTAPSRQPVHQCPETTSIGLCAGHHEGQLASCLASKHIVDVMPAQDHQRVFSQDYWFHFWVHSCLVNGRQPITVFLLKMLLAYVMKPWEEEPKGETEPMPWSHPCVELTKPTRPSLSKVSAGVSDCGLTQRLHSSRS